MKKLKLNKLFHWLYAFLMLYPILNWLVGMAVYFFNGSTFNFETTYANTPWDIFENVCLPKDLAGSSNPIYLVVNSFEFLVMDVLGCDIEFAGRDVIIYMLSYWSLVSIAYLVFDVIMLPINIAHHWIDKGSDSL